MNKTELKALISLLDDPDEEIYGMVQSKFLSIGADVIPDLEDAWENSFDTVIQSRIENIIHKIQFDDIVSQLKNWLQSPKQDLLEGTMIIAKYQYPDVDENKVKKQIQQIKQDVWIELNDNLTALEKIKVLNHIIFDVHNFSGNTTNYHAPQNSYINNVLESKKGNPLSLSILYAIICQELNIPIFGVNLPEHFILAYKDLHAKLDNPQINEVDTILFYVNPFSKGTVFGKKEVDAFLKQLKLIANPSYYIPCNNVEIVKRLLRNLISSYEKLGYSNKIDELKLLLAALS